MAASVRGLSRRSRWLQLLFVCTVAAMGAMAIPGCAEPHGAATAPPSGVAGPANSNTLDTNAVGISAGSDDKRPEGISAPEDVLLLRTIQQIKNAIDAGDAKTLVDLMIADDDEDQRVRRFEADYLITHRKVVTTIRAQFDPVRSERLINHTFGLSDANWGPGQDNRWIRQGTQARPDFLENRDLHVPWKHMTLVGGRWLIDCRKFPPSWYTRFDRQELLAQMKRLLANLNGCHTVAQAKAAYYGFDEEQEERTLKRRAIASVAQGQQQEKDLPPGRAGDETRLFWSLDLRSALQAAGDTAEESKFLYVQNDPEGTYALARVQWIQSVMQFNRAAHWEFTTSLDFAEKLGLIADFDAPSQNTEWSIWGDTATEKLEDQFRGSALHLRRVGTRWTMDMSKSAGSDPKASAAKLDEQRKALDELTQQIEAGSVEDLAAVNAALRRSGILTAN